jgi:hypothetical protein
MSWLRPEIYNVLAHFLICFSTPVSQSALLLAVGAILCTRDRTVTSCLRVMGLTEEKHFVNYHRVLNRSYRNTLFSAKILLGLLVALVPKTVPLVIVIDETIERRNGRKIRAKGCYRDAVRSSSNHIVYCFGLKWISMMLIIPLPWTRRPWALPFLTVLAPSGASDGAEGRRHKTTVCRARQMIMQVRRWLSDRAVILVGDGTYAAVSLALCCAGMSNPVTLVSRLRTDANLYDDPLPNQPGKRGPKPKKGKKQAKLGERIKDPSTTWETIEVLWYDGVIRTMEILSGISLWHTPGPHPVRIRWVVVRDPEGKLRTEAFFCTDTLAAPEQIIRWFVMRWNIEVTFEELRAHMGFGTQRQWSDKAIARTTPALFGLFSLIVLMASSIIKDGSIPLANCAWYKKSESSFSDVIALVRRHIWSSRYLANSCQNNESANFDENLFEIMLRLICYGT